jgi:3-methyladenine DNA glycosylase/8-oxoguanine DNA glycosylase
MTTFELPVRGPFSLAASTRFLEGFTPAGYRGSADGGPLRLAFPVEGDGSGVGVAVRQEDDGTVLAEVEGAVPGRLPEQLARILSLDVDGTGFPAVRAADPVVDELAGRYPGLRPVCFFSPYEAACWAVLAQRTSMVAAAGLKELIAQRHGSRHRVAGVDVSAFPGPATLRAVAGDLPVPEVKRQRLRALAEAALAGRLDGARLRALPADAALAEVQQLPGLGPFSAELVVVRGAGAPDVFPVSEPRLHDAMAALYGLTAPTTAQLAAVAGRWAPYRSWVSVLIRADRERRAVSVAHPVGPPARHARARRRWSPARMG